MLADGPGSSLQAPGFILCPLPPGLAELAARKYKQAAKCFLLASFDHCDFPEVRGKRVSGGEPTPALGRQGESPGVSSLGSLLQWGPGHSLSSRGQEEWSQPWFWAFSGLLSVTPGL